MFTLALDASQIGIALLIVLFLVISVLMVLVVLIQRPQGGGLSGAFGSSSDGAGQTAFGAKTGDALTTATILIFILFLVTAVGLNLLIKPPPASAPKVGPASTTPAGAGETGDETQTPEAPAGETPGDEAGESPDAPAGQTPASDEPASDEPASDEPEADQPTP